MERIRLGNNIAISWALYDLNGRVHSLENKEVQLYMSCGGLKQAVTDYTIHGNVVSWVFLGTEQKKVGLYKLILVETDALSGAQVVDVAEAFRLVSETLSAVETGEVTKNVSVRSVLTYSNLVGVESVDVVESSEDGGTNLVSIRLVDGNVVEIPIKNGSKGDTGATGATGATGPKGDKGDIGERGPAGIDSVEASIGTNDPTQAPSVDKDLTEGVLSLTFNNIKGAKGDQGEPAVAVENYVTVEATSSTTSATDVLPTTGSADTVYRVSNWDGTRYDANAYTEYGWYDGAYKMLATRTPGIDDEPTAGSDNLVKSGGINKILFNNLFVGANNTLQKVPIYGLSPNCRYRVFLPQTDWDLSGITYPGYMFFGIISVKGTTETSIIDLEYQDSPVVKPYYDFIAPSDFDYINICGRATAGVKVRFVVAESAVADDALNTFMLVGKTVSTADTSIVSYEKTFNTGYVYRIHLLQTEWGVSKVNPSFAKLIIGYKDSQDNEYEQYSVNQSADLDNYYDINLPESIGSTGKVYLKVRADKYENVYFAITNVDTISNYIKNKDTQNVLGLVTLTGNDLVLQRIAKQGCKANYIYRVTPSKTDWETATAPAPQYAKFVVGYKNSDGNDVDFVEYDVPDTIPPFVDIPIPETIGPDGELYIKARAKKGVYVTFSIVALDIDTYPVLVNSKIFKSGKAAWFDKDNVYESWPNGGVMADVDDIVIIYNSSSAHVARDLVSDIVMRKKPTLGEWGKKKVILQHTATEGYGNPSCCILPNGDYLVICSLLTASTVSQQIMAIKMIKSIDKGATWTDMGNVQVDGVDVMDECMMGLFCTSTGKLISFVGGNNNCKFIASDDYGETWRYVGDSPGTHTLEACFYERANGEILAILRKDQSTPALIKLNAELTSYEILYDFGTFAFPAYWNPSSITKMVDGKLYLLAGTRRTEGDYKFRLLEAIVTEEELLANNIKSRVILKANATNLMDWGYAQAVIAEDGVIYGFYYDSIIQGRPYIYELLGC